MLKAEKLKVEIQTLKTEKLKAEIADHGLPTTDYGPGLKSRKQKAAKSKAEIEKADEEKAESRKLKAEMNRWVIWLVMSPFRVL